MRPPAWTKRRPRLGTREPVRREAASPRAPLASGSEAERRAMHGGGGGGGERQEGGGLQAAGRRASLSPRGAPGAKTLAEEAPHCGGCPWGLHFPAAPAGSRGRGGGARLERVVEEEAALGDYISQQRLLDHVAGARQRGGAARLVEVGKQKSARPERPRAGG